MVRGSVGKSIKNRTYITFACAWYYAYKRLQAFEWIVTFRTIRPTQMFTFSFDFLVLFEKRFGWIGSYFFFIHARMKNLTNVLWVIRNTRTCEIFKLSQFWKEFTQIINEIIISLHWYNRVIYIYTYAHIYIYYIFDTRVYA